MNHSYIEGYCMLNREYRRCHDRYNYRLIPISKTPGPGVIPKLLTGPIRGLALYAVLRVCDGWRYTPVICSGVFLLGIGLFSVWTFWFSNE
jgi:hypothetical protein